MELPVANNDSHPPIENYFPHFQPLIYLPSGLISGYEMLARTHAAGKVVSAGALFSDPTLPVDYKIAVDRHLRYRGLDYFAKHADSGYITINISPDWIDRLDDNVYSPTMKMIDDAGIDPSRVVIEITETAGELPRLQRLVKQYHARGLRVAIDDFGAGNSQLDRIIALAPDMIKLDMRLFKMATKGGLSADVLLGMMAVAERAGCEIVCEGVETIEEFFFGIECGSRYMQGFLFSQAVAQPFLANHFKPQLAELVDAYFARKCARLSHTIDHSRAIKTAVLALQQQMQQLGPDGIADTKALHDLGIMRFFICNKRGEQLSPNYEVSATGIQKNAFYVGYNWSWRPYFPTLMAMQNRVDFDLVASTIYRDANTNRLCKTFGLFLDQQRILLVEAAVHDEILYADAPAIPGQINRVD
jgi:EAL domain-containing protein (putative c-di-GMP-specific phosphodiesterase class I)